MRALLLLLPLAVCCSCATPRPGQPRLLPGAAGEASASIGKVSVYRAERSLMVPGWVNQTEGAIELLACGPGGKTHESIFVMDVDPLDLQAGLLLLGLEPGEPLAGLGVGPPRGPRVEAWVAWEEAGGTAVVRAERCARYLPTREPLPETGWIFTGSTIEDGQFKAAAEETFLATYWDPWAILNINHPCGADDEVLVVETTRVPPLHTPVTFILEPVEER